MDNSIVSIMVKILRPLCGILGATAETVYSNLVKSRQEFVTPQRYEDREWSSNFGRAMGVIMGELRLVAGHSTMGEMLRRFWERG